MLVQSRQAATLEALIRVTLRWTTQEKRDSVVKMLLTEARASSLRVGVIIAYRDAAKRLVEINSDLRKLEAFKNISRKQKK